MSIIQRPIDLASENGERIAASYNYKTVASIRDPPAVLNEKWIDDYTAKQYYTGNLGDFWIQPKELRRIGSYQALD